MSQTLVPTSGGLVTPVTSLSSPTPHTLSGVYRDVRGLYSRPTEWVPGGRPIYRRLPSTSQTYQVDFFNVIPATNTAVGTSIEEVGYVFVPWGESINGPTSVEVVAAEGNKTLLIKGGNLVWKYGKTQVIPTIVDLEILDIVSGSYDISYQLIYDDSPVLNTYEVTDYLLSGFPLTITASTDSVTGWRYPAVNAFLESPSKMWKNYDSYYPLFAQPSNSFIQWVSTYSSSYTKVTLRAPSSTILTGTATLYAVEGTTSTSISTVEVSSDAVGNYFEFTIPATSATGWKVEFSSTDVSIAEILVSGVISLLTPPAGPVPRASLVMYPRDTSPPVIENSQGETIPAVYVRLANVDINSEYEIIALRDQREIIHRDYVPVADWLTAPFDETLISLYEQVDTYSPSWMSPPTALKFEYDELSSESIEVT